MSSALPMVLVVDDDALTRLMLRDALGKAGIGSLAAVDGQDALDRLRGGFRPSVILLDMLMPRLDGAAFLREIRATPDLADIPVITMSACPVWAEGLDVSARMQKPIEFEGLLEIVGTLCERASPTAAPTRL